MPSTQRNANKENLPDIPGIRSANRRDFGAQLRTKFATATEMANDRSTTFDRIHFKPLAPPTIANRLQAENIWIEYYTLETGSREKALATLERGAACPDMASIKQMVFYAATMGISRLNIKGVTGWSYNTTKVFVASIWGMRYRHGCLPPSAEVRSQLNEAVQEWSKMDKVINTQAKPKRAIREEDLNEVLTTCMLPSARFFSSNFMRIQMMSFMSFMFMHGTRPGTLLESGGYVGTGQCLKWKDTEWVVSGWDDGVGINIECIITLNWMKGQRMVDSDLSLGRHNIHLDWQLMVLSLAIVGGVFEDDILALHKERPSRAMPFELKVRKEAHERPVWLSKEKAETPMRLATAQSMFRKLVKMLGWLNATFRSFRYAFARNMTEKISKTNLRYLMGHSIRSQLAFRQYQVPDRPVDVTAARYQGEKESLGTSNHHSSVAWRRTAPGTLHVLQEKLEKNKRLQMTISKFKAAELLVTNKYGSDAASYEMIDSDDKIVVKARDLWGLVLTHYNHIATEGAIHAPLPAQHELPSGDDGVIVTETGNSPSSEDILQGLVNNVNPILCAIINGNSNPRSSVLEHYVTTIGGDRLRLDGICIFCHSNPDATDEAANKDHREHFSQHVMYCEVKNTPNTWRCPICALLIPVPNKGHSFSNEESGTASDPTEEADLEERNQPKASELKTFERYGALGGLSITSVIWGGGTKVTRVFCPICLYDENLPWSQRLYFTIMCKNMMDHIITHWSTPKTLKKDRPRTGIMYNKEFWCGLGSCDRSSRMKTGDMISHLHVVHQYRLLEYAADAKLDFELLGNPIPPVALVDHRNTALRQRNQKSIHELASNGGKKSDPPSDPTPTTIAKCGRKRTNIGLTRLARRKRTRIESPSPTPSPSTSPSRSSGPSKASGSAGPSSTGPYQRGLSSTSPTLERSCIAGSLSADPDGIFSSIQAFEAKYPQHASLKIAQFLVQGDITENLEALNTSNKDLRSTIPGLSMKGVKDLKNFLKEWVNTNK
ncbi:hypothetical protein CCMSSC00406_0009728 [Pleurotus cornucopiae]|uniref:Uncharacterized protein n=1 Tax=Pleurotus cornucopiae TaxID=5321 RepID=A0ACB7J987_PLECO|nr:hypothetical protein CCMSSC00406_0009728 [Pleurotus cornucopiae]